MSPSKSHTTYTQLAIWLELSLIMSFKNKETFWVFKPPCETGSIKLYQGYNARILKKSFFEKTIIQERVQATEYLME